RLLDTGHAPCWKEWLPTLISNYKRRRRGGSTGNPVSFRGVRQGVPCDRGGHAFAAPHPGLTALHEHRESLRAQGRFGQSDMLSRCPRMLAWLWTLAAKAWHPAAERTRDRYYPFSSRCNRTRFNASFAVRLWISVRLPPQLNACADTPPSHASPTYTS